MANVDLKSLTIQGLDDTYVIPQNLNEMAGTLDVDKGGTGVNSVEDLKEVLDIEDVVSVSKGGTGATTAQQARANLGLSFDAGSNYTKLPDGTLIQWGTGDTPITNGQTITIEISYSFPFKSVPYLFPIALTSYPDAFSVSEKPGGTGSKGLIAAYCNRSGFSSIYYDWIAIGRWK